MARASEEILSSVGNGRTKADLLIDIARRIARARKKDIDFTNSTSAGDNPSEEELKEIIVEAMNITNRTTQRPSAART